MNFTRGLIVLFASMLIATPVLAQRTLGIGSTKGGVVAAVTTTISKVVSLRTDLKMRPQPMGGTQQYIPVVNSGEMDFGISNAMQFGMAISGTGLAKGRKYENLRVICKMMTFRTGPLVAKDSGITRMEDIKGKRVPYGFKAAPLFQFIFTAYLTNAGLTWEDVTKVPVVGLRQNFNMFKQGKTDLSIGNPGSGLNKDMQASVRGGVRHLSLLTDTPGAKQMLVDMPRAFYMKLDPSPKFSAIVEPTQMMAYPFLMWTHKGMDDQTAYRITKVMYDHEAELKESSPVWTSYHRAEMAEDHGGIFHPGAIKFYREVGLWKR